MSITDFYDLIKAEPNGGFFYLHRLLDFTPRGTL